ncbi:MAG: NAD(P)H-binding protein [Deltaproteobacteria bacterium]|nr:NAD(P)H-binding protein [Deltaproteobacteria bacterium]
MKPIFVAGASGFVGRLLVEALVAEGFDVRAGSRKARTGGSRVSWVPFDLDDAASVADALSGCDAAYFLVHGMARGRDYTAWESRAALVFRAAAKRAGIRRIVYLGGMAPAGRPSPHLASRLAVGELLRGGDVPVVELRASMLIGPGSASWVVARDLAFRLPVMLVPRWVMNRTQPLAVEDALVALVSALRPDVAAPSVIELPGPETVSMAALFRRIAAHRELAPRMLPVPVLTPRLSSHWLRLVTRANYDVAKELVLGLESDVLARSADGWRALGHPELIPLDVAIRRTLLAEAERGELGRRAELAERWLGALTRRLSALSPRAPLRN